MKPLMELIHYAIQTGLITVDDYDYAFNRLCTLLGKKTPYHPYDATHSVSTPLMGILTPILDQALSDGLLKRDTTQERDLFEARIMDVFTPHPSALQQRFERLETISPKTATNDFYHRSQYANYIKLDRIRKNISYTVPSVYGDIHITINKSKPEKDPRAIAMTHTNETYPKCLLCKENVGFYGHASHPGRSNHRIIKLMLNDEPFYFQYSPYVYYEEHAIVLHEAHIPMRIASETFNRLFDFVDRFPHYFLGSNAALPIVGGSILSHEHYQGGYAQFPIDRADAFYEAREGSVTFELLEWPLSTIRLSGCHRKDMIEAADALLRYFKAYDCPDANLYAETDAPHNTVNPILRQSADGTYHLLIILRNNRTSTAYPDGIFHPRVSRHHIKRENIGLIEAMGLAILPPRLETAFAEIERYLKGERNDLKGFEVHADWVENTLKQQLKSTPLHTHIRQAAGQVFIKGLEDCGIFKQTPEGKAQFKAFIDGFMQWR